MGGLGGPAAAARDAGVVVPGGGRGVVAGGRPVVEAAVVEDEVAEAAVVDHALNDVYELGAAVGQGQGAEDAALGAEFGGGAQTVGAVGEGLVEQEGQAALGASADVVGHLGMFAGNEDGVGPAVVEALAYGAVGGTVEFVGQLLARAGLGVHDGDDLVAEVARCAGHAATMMTVGK